MLNHHRSLLRRAARLVVPAALRSRIYGLLIANMKASVFRRTGGRVAAGPFAGMAYVPRSLGSALAPKLLGAYEKELWPAIEAIKTRPYELLVDIGAGEGYYAVGLARALPEARSVCFEASEEFHDRIARLAELNGVADRLEIRGLCTPLMLNETLASGGRCLVLSDAEGGEQELIDPRAVPRLVQSDLLVELHEFNVPGIGELLRRRFGETHYITQFDTSARTPADIPASVHVPRLYRELCLTEFRPGPMQWLWMTANT